MSKDAADQAKNAYDQAKAQVGLDEASIQQYQATLEAAKLNLGYTDIIAPVDGIVVSRNVTQGQTVASSLQTPTLFLIATDLKTMQVDTNVSESDVGGVKQGDKATFTVDAYPKRTFTGAVTQVRVNPQTVQNVVTYDAVVSAANDDLALLPGMTAATNIVVDQRLDALRVPDQALRYVPGGLPRAGTSEGAGGNGTARVWVLRDGKPVADRRHDGPRRRHVHRNRQGRPQRRRRRHPLRGSRRDRRPIRNAFAAPVEPRRTPVKVRRCRKRSSESKT